MILSLFIRDKEFHICSGDFEQICKIEETKKMADKIPVCFKEFISQINFREVDTILYSSGPASFTTARIMNSMLKGIKVTCQSMKFIGISNFITYLSILLQRSEQGMIAIPTMRGDYFVCTYLGNKLSEMKLEATPKDGIIYSNDKMFNNINLALQQYNICNHDILLNNSNFVTYDLSINYGITPEYTHPAINRS